MEELEKGVPMIVRCISENCINCPDLNIEVSHFEVHDSGQIRTTINDFRCSHIGRCKQIARFLTKKGDN